jgi:hypothetical protein
MYHCSEIGLNSSLFSRTFDFVARTLNPSSTPWVVKKTNRNVSIAAWCQTLYKSYLNTVHQPSDSFMTSHLFPNKWYQNTGDDREN